MNKVFLIIKREFLTRVQKKSFLIATLLVPLIFPAIIGGLIYFKTQESKNGKKQVIEVLDESGMIRFKETSSKYEFVYLETNLEAAKTAFQNTSHTALIHISKFDLQNPEGFTLYTKTNPSLSFVGEFKESIQNQIREKKLELSGIDQATLNSLQTKINLRALNVTDTGEEKESDAALTFGIGYLAGFLIYLFIFIYGAQVMQGVIEEKSSKVIEIIVSSVRPFQLMLGKVVGVASVGLLQFLIWIFLMMVVTTGIFSFYGIDGNASTVQMEIASQVIDGEELSKAVPLDPKTDALIQSILNVPYAYIISCFIFYFIGGYLLYGALFAAVGSAVDTPADAQQFMFPITIPLIVGIFGLFVFVLEDPSSTMSFWLSIIPFTSPIAMMGRVGFGVPAWELALSMALLIGGFIFTIWLAGRIYRIGILMHGTKVNYKVLAKWLLMRN
jgi:ABC-2 type transport system permease protein